MTQSFLDDILNRAVGGLALVTLAPLLCLIAMLIKLSSPGPVLYSEMRVGLERRRPRVNRGGRYRRALDLGGKPFVIYKFWTLHVAPESGELGTARLTSVGRLLRRSHLDELPQLFNVLRGDMRLVGPRPERPSVFAELCQNVADYPLRQHVKPGVIGLAQLYQDCDRSLEDVRSRLEYDLQYIHRRGLLMDLNILARSSLKVVSPR
jgi:lipopolysaccharide/colanic/teichoic acid biosynthesis glycosyltransferase